MYIYVTALYLVIISHLVCNNIKVTWSRIHLRGWRNDLVVKNLYCFCRMLELGFQNPYQEVYNTCNTK